MKRKLQLSSFDVSPPEQLEIRIRKSDGLQRVDHCALEQPLPGTHASRLPEADPVVLTRTFARCKWVEGKRRSTAV